jgi:hypothetical protein
MAVEVDVEIDKETKGKLQYVLKNYKYGSFALKGIAVCVAAIVSLVKLLFWLLIVVVLYWIAGPGSVAAFLATVYIANDFLNEYDTIRTSIFEQLEDDKQ